jgi:ElaB/YqjD/DUF883 family membrane-anchored ribosome-binding protein
MDESLSQDNVVDKAASSATKVVDATRTATSAAFNSVAETVESVRSTLSPALNKATAPMDVVLKYTREKPVNALLAAAGTGALLLAILRPRRRRTR